MRDISVQRPTMPRVIFLSLWWRGILTGWAFEETEEGGGRNVEASAPLERVMPCLLFMCVSCCWVVACVWLLRGGVLCMIIICGTDGDSQRETRQETRERAKEREREKREST